MLRPLTPVTLAKLVVAILVAVATACGGADSSEEAGVAVSPEPVGTVATVPTADNDPTMQATSAPTSVVETPDAADPDPSGAPERATGRRKGHQTVPSDSAPAPVAPSNPAPASGDIADVNFADGFTYAVADGESVVTVTASEGATGAPDNPATATLYVVRRSLGDLDGDGDDEAVVWTTTNYGGSGLFDELRVFDVVGEKVEQIASTHYGDRGDGGIQNIDIGARPDPGPVWIDVASFRTDQGACCPNMVVQDRLMFGPDGFEVVEAGVVRRWLSLDGFETPELRFLPGTSSALVRLASVDDELTLDFDAAAGQHLVVELQRGSLPNLELRSSDDTVVALDSAGATVAVIALVTSGPQTLTFGATDGLAATLVAVSITDEAPPTEPLPSWRPVGEWIDLGLDPEARLTRFRPEFTARPVDQQRIDRLNAEIEAWLADRTDWWLEDTVEYPPIVPAGDDRDGGELGGTYDWRYRATWVAPDIVSFHYEWYEYVCCRPHPNLGQATLLVDLAQGRVLEAADVFDLARADELHAVWLAASAETDHPLTEADLVIDGAGAGFTSFSLVPGGVEFGTDRWGPVPPTSTFVSFNELGDLFEVPE